MPLADIVITQLFYDNTDYFDFCDRCETAGIEVPIVLPASFRLLIWLRFNESHPFAAPNFPTNLSND